MKSIGHSMKKMVACHAMMFTAAVLACIPALGLKLGDEAPPVSIQEWVQGGPVEMDTASDTVYVVEFWATWCGPCRKSIPILNALHEQHQDAGLVIIGITDEDKETVTGFIEDKAMKYPIAIDQDSETWAAYAESAGVDGIPYAFIARQGKVLWHGSPLDDLDKIVLDILENRYDLEKALADQRTNRLAEVWVPQYMLLAAKQADSGAADALGNRILEEGGNNASVLNELAWNIVSDKTLGYRNLDFALQAAEKACALTENRSSTMMDTCARILHEKGRTEEAIALQKQAIEASEDMNEKEEQLLPHLEEMENPEAFAQRTRLKQNVDLYLVYATHGLDPGEADTVGQRILSVEAPDISALSNLAWYIATGDSLSYRNLEFALQLAEKAVALTEQKDPDILDTYAEVLFKLGRKEEAIAQLRLALEGCDEEDMREMLEDNLAGMENGAGGGAEMLSLLCDEYRIYADLGQSGTEADALGQRLLEQSGSIASPLSDLADYLLSEETLAYRNLDFARQLAEKACEISEHKDPHMLITHAQVLLEMGQKEQATGILKQAVEIAEDDETRAMIEDLLSTLEEEDMEIEKEEAVSVPDNAA